MTAGEYTRIKVRNKDKSFSGSPRAKSDKWQLVIERDVPNLNYIPKAEAVDADGNDTRTRSQKRRTVSEQKSKMYKGEPVTEAKAKECARAWLDSENAKQSKPQESDMYVADYVDSFLQKHDVAESTLTGYLSAAKHIRKGFSKVRMTELTARDIESWLAKLKAEGYSEQTRYADFKVLRMVCKYAARYDVKVIDYDPCDSVRKRPEPNKTRENAENNCLTFNAPDGLEPTYDKHLRVLADMELTPMVCAAYLATYAGMRCGEVCGLRWWDVDFDKAVIRVRNAIATKGRIGNNKGGAYLKDAKTDKSKRDIPISATLAEKLLQRKERMRQELEEAGIAAAPEMIGSLFVVGSIDGGFANPTALSKQWTAHAEAFGLRGETGQVVTFHGLRHTFASRLVQAKKDVKTVSDLMGHANASLTLNVYASSNEQAKRDAIDAL